MSTLICRRLSFSYDGCENLIFSDLNLVIDTSWCCCLVGSNGRGKTTLLRLLNRQLLPDKGSVEYTGTTRYFPQVVENVSVSAFAVAKNAAGPYAQLEQEMQQLLACGDELALRRYSETQERYRQLGGYEINALLAKELIKLGITEDKFSQPYGQLSGGEQSRCLLSALFLQHNSFALIDEPTNHLDREGREHLASYLKSKKGFLLVSHDRAFLDKCIDHVVALNPDDVDVQKSSFSNWRDQYHRRLSRQTTENAALRKEIRSLSDAAQDRRAGANKREGMKSGALDKGFVGSRAARQMKRALSIEKRADQKIEARKATQPNIEKQYEIKFPQIPTRKNLLISISSLVIFRPKPLFPPLSFDINSGTRVAIRGKNGSGKSSLLDLLRGVELEHTGSIAFSSKLRISRSHQQPLWQYGSLKNNLEGAGIDQSQFRLIMATLGVRGEIFDQPLESFSLGQLKKVELARTLVEPSDLILWDEPLNFLDLDTAEQLELAILRDLPTMIFVEHDEAFIENVATNTLELDTS